MPIPRRRAAFWRVLLVPAVFDSSGTGAATACCVRAYCGRSAASTLRPCFNIELCGAAACRGRQSRKRIGRACACGVGRQARVGLGRALDLVDSQAARRILLARVRADSPRRARRGEGRSRSAACECVWTAPTTALSTPGCRPLRGCYPGRAAWVRGWLWASPVRVCVHIDTAKRLADLNGWRVAHAARSAQSRRAQRTAR